MPNAVMSALGSEADATPSQRHVGFTLERGAFQIVLTDEIIQRNG